VGEKLSVPDGKPQEPVLHVGLASSRETVQPEGGILTAAATEHMERGSVAVENNSVAVLPQLPAAEQDEGGGGASRKPRPSKHRRGCCQDVAWKSVTGTSITSRQTDIPRMKYHISLSIAH
jgi:hypothetical protein